jgi:ABC-type nickel/cobalt efflux system permease component RcnA
MRRLVALLVAAAALVAAPAAGAHPLGNFSENHLTVVRVGAGSVEVRWILDQAEIPTFQERGLSPAAVLARKRADVARGLTLTAGGRPIALALRPGGRITFPKGQGGLPTTRIELLLGARARVRGELVVRDATFQGRVGWRAVVARPGAGTAVRSDVPSADPTHGLRVYPRALLSSPADRPLARLMVRAGQGTVTAPRLVGAGTQTERGHAAGDGLAGVFAGAAAGRGTLLFLLLAAFGWGALHALSPGHGKAMVAAYLVGTRGRPRHAVALGITVTVTHTIGVFALGLVTLALSAYVVPEDLYPWLNLASGLLVLGVGGAVLRARMRHRRAHHHGHHHDHAPEAITPRSLLAMGASAGLIPCPSALVVLLAAVAQHQVALGLTLIVAFSLGLAATLTALGLAVVRASALTARLSRSGRLPAVLPAASALVIVAAGALLTAQAVPQVLA